MLTPAHYLCYDHITNDPKNDHMRTAHTKNDPKNEHMRNYPKNDHLRNDSNVLLLVE